MIALLLNMVFFACNVLFSLVTRAIFTFIAHLIVLVIQKLKSPGDEAKGLLEQGADLIKSWLEYLFEFLVDGLNTLVSSGFDLLKEVVAGSVAGAGSAVADLVEKTRDSLQGLFDTSEVFEGFSEMIGTMFGDFWGHFKNAIGYVVENIG